MKEKGLEAELGAGELRAGRERAQAAADRALARTALLEAETKEHRYV